MLCTKNCERLCSKISSDSSNSSGNSLKFWGKTLDRVFAESQKPETGEIQQAPTGL